MEDGNNNGAEREASVNITHIELSDANEFVAKYHRHHKPVVGHRFSIGAEVDGELVGVVIVGRPVARNTDQKNTLEVTRLCTNGQKNACSFLYSAAARAGKALGYRSIQTFILDTELGTSLRASGWKFVSGTKGGSWSVPSRHREDDHPLNAKQKWQKELS